MIVPETEKSVALRIAERLRKAVEEAEFEGESVMPTGRLTISIGVAAYPEDGPGKRDLISAADRALYQAKQSGRNRVCASLERVTFPRAGEEATTASGPSPPQAP